VARLTIDLLRAFVFAWLLLTVPVVCHHETAVVVLGGLAASPTHQHGSSPAVHAHATTAGTDPAGAVPGTPSPASGPPPTSGPEWCAHHATAVTSGLPSGLDGLALFECANLPAPRPGPTISPEAVAGASTTDAPVAPPPRLLA
jgi:hypothetical protein